MFLSFLNSMQTNSQNAQNPGLWVNGNRMPMNEQQGAPVATPTTQQVWNANASNRDPARVNVENLYREDAKMNPKGSPNIYNPLTNVEDAELQLKAMETARHAPGGNLRTPTKKPGLGGKLGIVGAALGLATGANAADLVHGLNPLSVLDGGSLGNDDPNIDVNTGEIIDPNVYTFLPPKEKNGGRAPGAMQPEPMQEELARKLNPSSSSFFKPKSGRNNYLQLVAPPVDADGNREVTPEEAARSAALSAEIDASVRADRVRAQLQDQDKVVTDTRNPLEYAKDSTYDELDQRAAAIKRRRGQGLPVYSPDSAYEQDQNSAKAVVAGLQENTKRSMFLTHLQSMQTKSQNAQNPGLWVNGNRMPMHEQQGAPIATPPSYAPYRKGDNDFVGPPEESEMNPPTEPDPPLSQPYGFQKYREDGHTYTEPDADGGISIPLPTRSSSSGDFKVNPPTNTPATNPGFLTSPQGRPQGRPQSRYTRVIETPEQKAEREEQSRREHEEMKRYKMNPPSLRPPPYRWQTDPNNPRPSL